MAVILDGPLANEPQVGGPGGQRGGGPALEEQLARRTREMEALARLGADALAARSRDEVDRRAAAALAEATGADVAAVFALDPEQRTLVQRAGASAAPDSLGSFGERVLAAVEGTPIGPTAPHPLPAALGEAGVADGLLVPIRDGAASVGALGVFYRSPGPPRGAASFVQAAANLVGLCWRQWDAASALERSEELLAEADGRAARDERLRALGQLASGIAHDFNNHLTPIIGFTDLLLDDAVALGDPDKARRYLSLVRTAAQGAASAVLRLREFYRKRDDHDRAERFDVNAVMTSAMALAEPMLGDEARARGKQVRFELRLEARRELVGDADELRDAVLNLILNAVDALPPEGGTISLRTRDDDRWVVLEVSDDGCGMSEVVRQRCLEPFFTTKGKDGTGLGLPQVWGIVQRHDGQVDIHSQPGAGTTVVLTIPVDASGPRTQRPSSGRLSRRLRVLVVDDEPSSRALLHDALTLDGHEVVVAAGGAEALKAVTEERFDLLITDRSMPEMSGDSVAVRVRVADVALPIVMLTGFGDLMTPEGRPHGVDLVLPKPVTLGRLRRAITDVLAMHADDGAR